MSMSHFLQMTLEKRLPIPLTAVSANISRQLSSPLVHVNVALLTNDVGETPADTLDGRQREHHLLSAINIGVAHTQDVLEILGLKLDRHSAKGTLSKRQKVSSCLSKNP